jgi:outer membrane autotransporter protein
MNQFKVALLSSMVLAACSVNAQNLVYTGNYSSNDPISVAVDISQGNKYGIDLSKGATVTLDGPSISISLTGANNTPKIWIEGVESREASSLLNLGGAQTKNINVSVNVDSSRPAVGLFAYEKGKITLNGENLNINVHSTEGEAKGIQVQNNTTSETEEDKKASVIIDAKNTVINATSDNAESHGIVAISQGVLRANGNIEINADKVIVARGDSTVRINESGTNTVVLNGDIDFNYDSVTSGTKIEADVLVNLTGASSQWTGNVQRSHDREPADDKVRVTGFKLIVADNAQWNPTIITRAEGVVPIAVNSLTLNDGIINITKADQKVAIETLQGSGGTVNVAATTNGTTITSAQLQVTNEVTGAPHLTVNAVGLTSDQITNQKEAMESFYASALNLAEGSDATATLNIVEGGAAGALTAEVAKDGSMVVKEAQNTVNSSLIDIAASNYLFFRSQMNDVSARLGDLRSMPKTAGAWVRYYGGKNKYSSGNMSEKYNTVQLGGDGFINDNFYLGGTFSYTHGDGDLRNGSTDDKNFNFGIYGGWLGDSGQFVDVIIKRHRVKSDFSLYNTMGRNSGSFHNWGTSASVEAGWRLQCPDTGFYVEPQAELQFGRLDSVDYKTNKGVKVEQDGIDSFVGRAGVAVGYTFPENKGNAYAKASVLHDWKGEVKSTFSSNGAKRTYRDDLGGTWGEFAVGGTFNPTKNISAYGQVKTSAGSPVRNPWQVSIGVRYSF